MPISQRAPASTMAAKAKNGLVVASRQIRLESGEESIARFRAQHHPCHSYGVVDRRRSIAQGADASERCGAGEPLLDIVGATLPDGEPRVRQAERRRTQALLIGEPRQPAPEGLRAADRRDVDETFDHEVLGPFDIAGPLRVQDGPAEIAMQFVPAAGPSMQLGDQLGLTPGELSFEELADEWVHSEPCSVLSQGDDEEVALASDLLQARAAASDFEHRVADRAGERVQDGRPGEEPHEVFRLAIQELLSEVVPHRRIDHVDRLSAGAYGLGAQQGAHRQAKPGRPALGSLHQLLDGAGREIKRRGRGPSPWPPPLTVAGRRPPPAPHGPRATDARREAAGATVRRGSRAIRAATHR